MALNFKKILLLVAIGIIFPAFVFASQQFEGKLVFNMKAEGQDMDMAFLFKGQKFAMSMSQEGRNIKIIGDAAAKTTYVVMEEEKMYMEQPMMVNSVESDTSGKIERTGKIKKILGADCELWISTETNGDKSDIWSANNLGDFVAFSAMGVGGMDKMKDMMKLGKNEGFFPLEITTKDSVGTVKMTMIAKEINKSSVSDSQFQIPSGFTKMEMPSGMGGFGK